MKDRSLKPLRIGITGAGLPGRLPVRQPSRCAGKSGRIEPQDFAAAGTLLGGETLLIGRAP